MINQQSNSKGITISFVFSPDVEKEFNDKLLELMSTEGVLYDNHKTEEEKTIILSNNKNVKVKEIRPGNTQR
jgi:hypothetical protein